eukprot:m.27317 g.27317  ORF g.27317 m.27317 type:complete len:813 (+) comp29920_c0_seq6:228-2666(+)
MDDDILLGSELRDDDDDGNDQEVKEASGDDDDDDDPVVQEIDVFLSRKLSDNLCVLQFPLRPADRPFVSTHSTATARIKPKQQKLQVEFPIDTENEHYDQRKGRKMANDVELARTPAERNTYDSPLMDKQLFSSDSSFSSVGRYAIGVLRQGQLHLTPISRIFRLRPSFDYLDQAEKGKTASNRAKTDMEVEEDGEEEARPVTVRLVRQGDDRGRASRSMAMRQQEQEWDDESWTELNCFSPESNEADEEWDKLVCPSQNVQIQIDASTPEQYIKTLCPPQEKMDRSGPSVPSNVVSLAQLKSLDLVDQVKALLTSAKVMRFSQLCLLLEASSKQAALLKILPTVGWLVQGCWTVKSELVYPDGKPSAVSGVSADALRRGRDYVLWKFSQTRFIIRKDVSSIVKLPFEDLKDILEQVAKLRVTQGWEFLCEYDDEFIKRHGDCVAKQQQLWDVRYKRLCEELNIGKTERVSRTDSRKGTTESAVDGLPSLAKPRRFKVAGGKAAETLFSGKGKEKSKAVSHEKNVTTSSEKQKSKSRKVHQAETVKKEMEESSAMKIGEARVDHPKEEPIVVNLSAAVAAMATADIVTEPMEVEVGGQVSGISPVGLTALVEAASADAPGVYSQSSLSLQSTVESSAQPKRPASVSGFQAPARIPAASAQLPSKSSTALVQFVRELLGHTVRSMKDVRDRLMLKQEAHTDSHPLNAAVISDSALERAMHSAGAIEIEYKRKFQMMDTSNTRLFTLKSTGDQTDKYRHVLLNMFKEGIVWQKKQVLKRIQDVLGVEPTQREITKVLKDLCICKSNKYWHLIMT